MKPRRRPTIATPAGYRPPIWFTSRFSKLLDQHGRLPPAPRPPRWPLVSGVFTFPWRRVNLAKWLSLSIWAALIAAMGLLGWSLGQGIGRRGHRRHRPGGFQHALAGLGRLLRVYWAGIFFINLLAILGDTAAGADNVGQWPNATTLIDSMGSTFFVINSLALSVLAATGLGWLLERVGLPGGFAMVGVPLVLFPLVLLSVLEADSPFMPVSKAVWRSLARNWRAWLGFYLETIPLVAVSGGIAWPRCSRGALCWPSRFWP